MHHLYKSTKPRKMVYEFIRAVYFSGLPQTSILLISVDSTWPFGKAVPNKFKEILPFLAFLHLTPPAPHLPAALVTADYYPPSKSHCLTASVQHFILQSFSNIIVVFLLPAHTCWEPLNSLSTMLYQFRKNAHYCFPAQPRFCPSCRQKAGNAESRHELELPTLQQSTKPHTLQVKKGLSCRESYHYPVLPTQKANRPLQCQCLAEQHCAIWGPPMPAGGKSLAVIIVFLKLIRLTYWVFSYG